MIKADTVLCHELIGLKVRILDNTGGTMRKIAGSIIKETKNTFSIRTSLGTKVIPKRNATKIEVSLDSGVCFISGSSLIGRPEDRLSRNS
jgi:ribonuclease P protein subunit POP4